PALRRVRRLRRRGGPQAPGGRALGQVLHLLPAEAGARVALTAVGLAASASRLILDPVLAVVFPSRCPACARTLDSPRRGPLCEPCWSALPRHRGAACGCGAPLAPGLPACGRCRRGLSPFAAGASLGPYEGVLRVAVHELKYRSRRRVAGRISEAMLDDARVRVVLDGAQALVPVPLHPRRQRTRGFNQSELLADALGRRAGIAVTTAIPARRPSASARSSDWLKPRVRCRRGCRGTGTSAWAPSSTTRTRASSSMASAIRPATRRRERYLSSCTATRRAPS